MAQSTLWWLATGGLIALELLSGTFYLLMMALGLAAAAMCAHAGLAPSWQWICAALVGGGSVLAWWAYQRQHPDHAPAQSNQDVLLDLGARVQVDHWQDDQSCTVHYRGAQWQAQLLPGERAEPGTFEIVQIVGSRLILKKPSSTVS